MINDDTLTLYYYDELSPDERLELERGMRDDPGLATQYAALKRDLDGLPEPRTDALPPHMLAQFHDTIDRAANLERQAQAAEPEKSGLHLLSFAWGAAVAAVLVLGISASIYLGGDEEIERLISPPTETVTAVPASFTRGLQAHLQDSQFSLAKLSGDPADERTALLMQIINQNRMFEQAAVQNNSQKVARVLRAFEPILMRLASEDIAPEDAEALRAQLSFELSIMLTKLAQQTSEEPQSI